MVSYSGSVSLVDFDFAVRFTVGFAVASAVGFTAGRHCALARPLQAVTGLVLTGGHKRERHRGAPRVLLRHVASAVVHALLEVSPDPRPGVAST